MGRRAVDHEGEILKSFVTEKRDKSAALTFMKKTLKRHGKVEAIVTDGLRSYPAAMRDLGNLDRREMGRWLNNRAENSHLPLRRRERAMLRFRRMKSLQKFVSVHASFFFLPASAAWLEDYVYELCGFPGLKHDDQVDSTSQFLAWWREEGDPGGLYHYYEQEAERMRAFAEDRTVHMRAPANCNRLISITGLTIIVGDDGTIWLTELDARGARAGGFTDID